MSTEQLTQEALALPVAERVALAEALWQSIDGASGGVTDEEKDAVESAKRRDAELESGVAVGRMHEQVMQTARGALECE